jgi:hypothetical protein
MTSKTPAKAPSSHAAVPAPAPHHFAICVQNTDHPASLVPRKLYPVLDDPFADEHDMIRVVDESGEECLYPKSYFLRVELPSLVERTLAKIR